MILQLLKDFVSLFYPEVCLACGEGLVAKEEFVCTACMFKLPKTDFHKQQDNLLFNTFRGRANIAMAAAYCYYEKGNMVQKLVKELKYNGKKELGTYLGKWYGNELKQSSHFEKVEAIIPVPLHPRKLRKRGYNQSAYIAKGLAMSLDTECLENALARVKNTETQTRKSRYSRWENVQNIFEVKDKNMIMGKNILLVDDIISTGATIEACYRAIEAAQPASISVASLGYTPVS
jgi:ComF family protein